MLTNQERDARRFLSQRWRSPMGLKADEITAEMEWLVSKSEHTKSDDQRFLELTTRLREVSGQPHLINTCLAVERFRHEELRQKMQREGDEISDRIRADREFEESLRQMEPCKEPEYYQESRPTQQSYIPERPRVLRTRGL